MEISLRDIESQLSPINQKNLSGASNEELILAEDLKNHCSYEGKEYDPKTSAPILHKLGKEYQRRSCGTGTDIMFNLIKSAALYNAAIARFPEEDIKNNSKNFIENDLANLCELILQKANARYQSADLIAISKYVKKRVVRWRKRIENKLTAIQNYSGDERIDKVKRLQNQIAKKYIKRMAEVADYCERIMGRAPFSFAIAGMGSLARKEITPYSDFEHIILLSNDASQDKNCERKKDYYRWFSVIFNVILINLQETIIPSVAIGSLNNESFGFSNWFFDDFTTRGISFDGMMLYASKFPLGKQQPTKTELIKTVSEMLDYLSSGENLKNGYHLSDILTKTCFIFKHENVFNDFEHGISLRLTAIDGKDDIKRQVLDDLQKYSTKSTVLKLRTKEIFNIKQTIYRCTTLFISALGKLEDISAASSFDIIAELARKKIISSYAEEKLMFAVSLACELRLKWYIKNNKQCDTIESELNSGVSAIETLAEMIGKPRLMEYFQIAYALQTDVAKRLGLPKKHLCLNPSLFNLSINICFGNYELLEPCLSAFSASSNSSERSYNFDECLQSLQTRTVQSDKIITNKEKYMQSFGIILLITGLYAIARQCFETVVFDHPIQEAVYGIFLKRALEVHTIFMAYNYYLMGICMRNLGQHKEALQTTATCMHILHQVKSSSNSHFWIGCCLLQMQKPEEALEELQKSLQSNPKNVSANGIDSNTNVAWNYWVGNCYLEIKNPHDAIDYLDESLKLCKENLSSNSNTANKRIIAEIQFVRGKCLYFLQKSESAIKCFVEALQIYKYESQNFNKSNQVAEILIWIGQCLMNIALFDEAVPFFRLAINAKELLPIEIALEKRIIEINSMIGECLFKKNNFDDAANFLETSLKRLEHVSPDVNYYPLKSRLLKYLGDSLIQLKQNKLALYYYEELLLIQEKLSLDTTDTLDKIVKCFLELKDSKSAMKYLEQELHIIEENTYYLSCCKCCKSLDSKTKSCCVRQPKTLSAVSCYRKVCCRTGSFGSSAAKCFRFSNYVSWLFSLFIYTCVLILLSLLWILPRL